MHLVLSVLFDSCLSLSLLLLFFVYYLKNLQNKVFSLKQSLSSTEHMKQRRQQLPTPVLLPGKSHGRRSLVGCSPWGHKESDTYWATSLSLSTFHALKKEMAAHSSVLAWKIPGTGEPGGLPSMGSHRVRHDWSDLAAVAAAEHMKWKWNPSCHPHLCIFSSQR